MDRVSQEQLIEAFFDGDLNAVDRRQVESLLVESDAARRWFKQLQTMHAALAELPRQTLPASFAESVLRRAEQQMLKSTPVNSKPQPAVASIGDTPGLPRETWLRIWMAVAVAATAMFVVVLPEYLERQREANTVAFETQPAPSVIAPSETASTPLDGVYYERGSGEVRYGVHVDGRVPASDEVRKESGGESGAGPLERFSKQFAPPAGEGGPASSRSDEVNGEGRARDKLSLGKEDSKQDASEPAAAPVLSFVYDVPSPEAQQVVLKKFEQTLREQQIELEESPKKEGESLGFGGSGLGGGARSTGGLGNQPGGGKLAAVEDRVYVVEGTQAQVSNTINSLNDLAAPKSRLTAARRADLSQLELKTAQTQSSESGEKQGKDLPAQRPADPASQTPNHFNYNNAQQNRSQAYRLPTDFSDQSGYESGRGFGQAMPRAATAPPATLNKPLAPAPDAAKTAPSAPAAGVPARPGMVGQRSLNSLAESSQTEKLQRAVIIFRVVPGADAKGEADRPR